MGCGKSIQVKDLEAINYINGNNISGDKSPEEKVIKKNIISINTKSIKNFYSRKLPKGLVNNGNTCYMISPFQALINCKCFIQPLLKEQTIKLEKGSLIHEFIQFQESYCKEPLPLLKGKKSYINPEKLVNAICTKSKIFTVENQEDTHEFQTYLIDAFQEETKTEIDSSFIATKASGTSCPLDLDRDVSEREEEYWNKNMI